MKISGKNIITTKRAVASVIVILIAVVAVLSVKENKYCSDLKATMTDSEIANHANGVYYDRCE